MITAMVVVILVGFVIAMGEAVSLYVSRRDEASKALSERERLRQVEKDADYHDLFDKNPSDWVKEAEMAVERVQSVPKYFSGYDRMMSVVGVETMKATYSSVGSPKATPYLRKYTSIPLTPLYSSSDL